MHICVHWGNRVSDWHEIYSVYSGHVICNCFVYLHAVSQLYSCTVNACVHRQCYNAPLQRSSESLSRHQHTVVPPRAKN